MIAETVFPIVQALPKAEQIKLLTLLEQDLHTVNSTPIPREMTAKEKRKADMMKWLKQNVFYPP